MTQARKFIRPRKAPAVMTSVMAAKTNWKYTMTDIGKFALMPEVGSKAWVSSYSIDSVGPGMPANGSMCFPNATL